MELNILTSQKGTKVVTATNLHLALGLNNSHYNLNFKKWLQDVYEFQDSIRKPIPLRDFAKRKVKDNTILSDYYLSLELAKLITLKTNSKSKLKFALQLQRAASKNRNDNLLTNEDITEAIDLIALLVKPVYQELCEQQHFKKYTMRNGGSSANWWKYRAQVLGYSSDSLQKKAVALGKKIEGKSQRQILNQIDRYEGVRMATMDLLMAMDKTERYARKMGDLTKSVAQRMNWLDRADEKSTMISTGSRLVNQLKAYYEQNVLESKQLQRA